MAKKIAFIGSINRGRGKWLRRRRRMDKKKICNICTFCGNEPEADCFIRHPRWVQEITVDNILVEEAVK